MNKIFLLVLVLGLVSAYPGEVIRYADEKTKQSIYMEGEPGTKVSGARAFKTLAGKNNERTDKADDMGLQLKADFIPILANDTVEVMEAKRKFNQLYEEVKRKEAAEDEGLALEEDTTISVLRTKREDEAASEETAQV